MKNKLKRLLAFFLVVLILLPSLSKVLPVIINIIPFPRVYADDYVKSDEEDGVKYYIIEGKDVKSLFNFTLDDALSGQEAIDWLFNFTTYTVIAENTKDSNELTKYKVYVNTPNLQTLVKNQVISLVDDGYSEDTYDVNDSEWIVDVGKVNEDSEFHYDEENVIKKYGFAIPSYTYMGEYPKEVMSTAGIIPTSFWGKVWRAIKGIFGASFIKAPSADNFKTISYHNHGYKDKNEWIIECFQKYFRIYFINQIATNANTDNVNGDENGYKKSYDGEIYDAVTMSVIKMGKVDPLPYFTDPKDYLDKKVTKEENDNAVGWNLQHKEEILEAIAAEVAWNSYEEAGTSTITINGSNGLSFNITYHNIFFNVSGAAAGVIDSFVDSNADLIGDYLTQNTKWINNNIVKSAKGNLTLDSKTHTNDIFNNLANPKYVWCGSSNNSATKKLASEYNSSSDGTIYGYSYTDNDSKHATSTIINTAEHSALLHTYNFQRENFVSPAQDAVLEQYHKNLQIQYDYGLFCAIFNEGDPVKAGDNNHIAYHQCLIYSKDEEKCESKKYGDEATSISVASLYVDSGLYKIIEDPHNQGKHSNGNDNNTLTRAGAIKVIQHIQNYCGPYYTEVLANILKLMAKIAPDNPNDGDKDAVTYYIRRNSSDPRVMPYDTSSLVAKDRENYSVKDPRVEIYKDHIVGGVISEFTINWGIGIYIKPQKFIINLGGKITEIAVFFQRLCNLDKLDEWGLSPSKIWIDAYIGFLMGCIVLFFLFKTVISIIKMGTNQRGRLIFGFLVLTFELGLLSFLLINPDGTWNKVKGTLTSFMNLGEKLSSATFKDEDGYGLDYLYGDMNSEEVLYYLPYLDMWSKYNTGYGLLADQQKFDINANLPETLDMQEKEIPTIGDKPIGHYSVLLIDAFSYYGHGTSVLSVTEDGVAYNGATINNNAYRVVDHFLAPRFEVTPSGSIVKLSVTANENYNGEFQTGFFDLLVKLMNCLLAAFLSLIKFLTFIWLWFMLYIFIFNIMLGKGMHKTFKDTMIETFSPVLFLIFIGIYSGICIHIGMKLEGAIGFVFMLLLFWITFHLILIWRDFRQQTLFPQPMKPIAMLIDALFAKKNHKDTEYTEQRNIEQVSYENIEHARELGFEMEQEDVEDFNKYTNKLFDENGNMISHDSVIYEDWYMRADYELQQRGGNSEEVFDDQQKQAYYNYRVRVGIDKTKSLEKKRKDVYKKKIRRVTKKDRRQSNKKYNKKK